MTDSFRNGVSLASSIRQTPKRAIKDSVAPMLPPIGMARVNGIFNNEAHCSIVLQYPLWEVLQSARRAILGEIRDDS